MTHIRTLLRADVRAALSSALPGVEIRRDYWTKVTPKQLPRGGVGTPRTSNRGADADAVSRTTDLLVVIRRAGGDDLEDVLDADSVLVETTVLPVLAGRSTDYSLLETQISVEAGGEEPIGELSMLFRVAEFTPENDPETSI